MREDLFEQFCDEYTQYESARHRQADRLVAGALWLARVGREIQNLVEAQDGIRSSRFDLLCRPSGTLSAAITRSLDDYSTLMVLTELRGY
jgi:hypothetical protein